MQVILTYGPIMNFVESDIEARLEVKVQVFECFRQWSRRKTEAYHTIFGYLFPHISIHVGQDYARV